MKQTSALLVGWVLAATVALPAQETCQPEKPFAFALTALGRSPGASTNAEDFYLLPGEPVSLEVIAWLVTNPPGQTVTVDMCGLFSMFMTHDAGVLAFEQLDAGSTEAGTYGFVGGRPVDGETQHGFVAGAGMCLNADPHTFTGEMSLVQARYTLVAPHGAAGETITTSLRFEDQIMPPGIKNEVSGPDYQIFTPCLRGLEVRFHVNADSSFIRADANFDQRIDVSDPVTILRSLFQGDAPIRCSDAADSNDDGRIDISDAVYVFSYLFLGGPQPPAPFPEPGPDPSADDLHCIEHS